MMPEASHTVARLRSALLAIEETAGHGRVALGHPGVDERLRGGLLKGALHEVFAEDGHGMAAIGFALGLAARTSGKKPLLWIRQDYAALEYGELAGSGCLELGRDAKDVLLLRVGDAKDGLRATGDALTCASLGAVVFEIAGTPKLLDLTASRRLTLAAAAKGVSVFLARLDAKPDTSAAETRWRVRAAPSSPSSDTGADWGRPRFEASLARNRHGALGTWIMEWDCNNGHFIAATDSGAVAPASSDRPDRAQAQGIRRSA
jgi:protein ImuA